MEGLDADSNGDKNKALECFQFAILNHQEIALSYFGKGKILYDFGNYLAATEALGMAISLKPDLVLAYKMMVRSLQRLGKYNDAVMLLDKILIQELDGDTRADLLLRKGKILQGMGRNQESYNCVLFALGLDSKPDLKVDLYSHIGNLLVLIGNYEEALKAFKASADLIEDGYTLTYIGYIYIQIGNLPLANEYLNRAIKANPDLPFAKICKAKVLQLEGKNEQYKIELGALLEESPQDIRLQKLILSDILGGIELGPNLYHYTSVSALESILKNGELWVTRIDFLNDPSERTYILDLLKELPSAIHNDTDLTSEQKINMINLGSIILEILSILLAKPIQEEYDVDLLSSEDYAEIFVWGSQLCTKGVYVLSLSEDKDSLTLWGNYSKSDGYNIGFNTHDIFNLFQSVENSKYEPEERFFDVSFLGKVQYDSKLIYDEFKKLYLDWNNTISLKALATILLTSAIITSMFTKAPTFCPENEARAVFLILDEKDNDSKVHFRNYNSSFIPFIKVPIRLSDTSGLPIDVITIGPKNNMDISRTGLECFLQKYNITLENGIEKSKIPLRY